MTAPPVRTDGKVQERSFAEQLLFHANRHKVGLAVTVVAGAAIGLALTFVVPKEWEATSVLQVGQVYNVDTEPTKIEAVNRTVERLKLAPFQDGVLLHLGLPVGVSENKQTDLIRDSLKVALLRNADLVQFSVRGNTPEDAKRYVSAFADELIHIHSELIQPSIDKLKADMQLVGQSFADEEKRQADLLSLARERLVGGVSGKFSENVLLSQMINQNAEQLRTLRLRKYRLEEQLNPARTFNTRALGAVAISKRAVFPRKLPFTAGGALIGLLAGVLWAWWRDRRRR